MLTFAYNPTVRRSPILFVGIDFFVSNGEVLSWINFGILIVSSFLFTFFYVKSVGPAALEKRIGASAYRMCSTYRLIASVFMVVVAVNYVLYYWFPLPFPLPDAFPWPWWVIAFLVHSPFLVF